MDLHVRHGDDGHRLDGGGGDADLANRYLSHLSARGFSPATVRAYAFDILNFLRFCSRRALSLGSVAPGDLFDYLDWQARPEAATRAVVVRIDRHRGAAASTMNRRIAAVRGMFEYLLVVGERADNPVPAARRSSGLRASGRGLLGHLGPGRHRSGGQLVRQPRRLPESVDPADVNVFLADLRTCRDRAIVLAMVLGGLRAAEVRSLRLSDVDMGLRRLRVVGKGDKERVVPVDAAFFAECAAYLREERPRGCRTPQCFVVLRGPSAGEPVTESGLRSLFRRHRASSGATRVRPHRLRHTYGSELATAGMDLLVLRELMATPRRRRRHATCTCPDEAGGRVRRGEGGEVVMSALAAAQPLTRTRRADESLMSAYARHCVGLGLAATSVEDRLAGAEAFLAHHPDLAAWMTRPLLARLTDLKRFTFAWPLVSFAILTGRVRADFDLLAAKHAGRGFANAVAAIYPDDVAVLRAAATRLDWAEDWTKAVLGHGLPLVVAATARPPLALSTVDIEAARDEVRASPHYTYSTRRTRLSHLHSLTRLLYEARIVDMPPIHRRGDGPGDLPSRLAHITAPAIRDTMLAWLRAKQTVVKVHSIRNLASHLAAFGEYLSEHHPELTSLTQVGRHHIEAFCTWVPTRHWRGQRASEQRIGPHSVIAGLVSVRGFLDDISAWGWAEAPARRLMFGSDIPRPPRQLPRALSPDIGSALMAAVAELPDRFARIGLTVLRGAGLRIGELLDLELDCVIDYGPAGVWLRLPLGKLNTERSVPLDGATIAAITEWKSRRGIQRAPPHQRDDRMVDFLFVERGRRPGAARIERGLHDAVRAAGLVGPDGAPLHVTAHQLRHTYATAFANAGMSIQAIMALLGHSTPEMTLRYATLASPTLRNAYETAMGRMRPRLPLAPVGKPLLPDKAEWLNAEMLKTRLAGGFCARELVADACPYANICETCDNFVTSAEFLPALHDQLADLHALRQDATERGWDSETARHGRVITSLEAHVRRLETPRRDPLT